MRPLKLQLKNFGPFLDETIDFSSIQSNQLFLISGKTGSGKTMIFDGIVYALYGRASTEKREVKYLRSHFATASEPLAVSFEFEIKGHRYKVVREASFLKPGNKNETKPKLEVYRYDKHQFVLLESTIQAGEKFILDLLKLKQNQFRQLFVLPQGEFKAFLVSNSTDKQTILRTLFNTQLYDKLKNQLSDKTKNMKNKIDQIYTKIQSVWDELYTLDYPELNAEKNLKREQYDMMIDVLPQFERIAEVQIAQCKSEKQRAEQDLEQVTEALNRQHLRQQLTVQLQELEEALTRLKTEASTIAQLEKKLKLMDESKFALKMCQDLQEVENALRLKQQDYSEMNDRQAQLKQQQLKQQHALEQHVLNENEMTSNAAFLEHTRYFYQECEQLKEKNNRMLKVEDEIRSLQVQNADVQKRLDKIDQRDMERQPDYESKSKWQSQQLVLAEQVTRLLAEQKNDALKKQQQLKLESLTTEWQQIDQALKEQACLIQDLSQSEQQLIDHEQAVMTLRAVIHVDAPCPVCGQIVQHVNSDEQIAHIKAIQQKNRRIEKQMVTLKEQKIKCESDLNHTKQRITEMGDADFEEEKLLAAQSEQRKINAMIEKIDLENERLARIQQEVTRNRQILNDNNQNIEVLKKEQAYLQEHLQTFESETGYQDIQVFQKAYTRMKATVDTFFDRKREWIEQCEQTAQLLKEEHYKVDLVAHQINEMTQKVQSLNSDIDAALKALDIPDRAGLFDILKESVHKETYRQKVSQFHQQMQMLQLKRDDILHQISEIPVESIDELTVQQSVKRETYQLLQKRYNEFSFQATQNQKTAQKLRDEVAHLKTTLSEQLELFQLAEVLNGKNEHHLTLENYVLMHYLEQILLKANQRLLSMTGQRYELVRNKKKGRGFSGLEIEVYDYYSNQSRHITSLSGGETFQASLALALGLSEVVQSEQGGIALDAMFIDEGFGTLDQETLETALDTLIQLQSSGRLVGIISHVSELKNRIPIILEVMSQNYRSRTQLKSNG